mmetsp:Transcript_20845/g.84882  ORF Transcript_20845/g.84882 Transcript_20845/m.84882 type:complete len:86 (+) Transcript_20845:1732-1989(+)
MGSLTREISLKFSPTAMTTLTQDQTLVSGSKGALCLIPSGDGEQIIQSQTKFPFPEQLKVWLGKSVAGGSRNIQIYPRRSPLTNG